MTVLTRVGRRRPSSGRRPKESDFQSAKFWSSQEELSRKKGTVHESNEDTVSI